ncbi:MAG: polyphosphate polymerase domain-containing protein [Kiritimatiellae bacterium]|nr:polyphosphate polymerase domain-containing protein [Kiritimatiellia bacterium]MCB1102969.1 polyphosphate polymerase domain-containing protein [Kiritimatiellia bacterium]
MTALRQSNTFDIQLDRHEAKYIVPESIAHDVVQFIEPFCEPDPHGTGDPPEYVITTLQLDNARYSLHHAKQEEAVNRFKLRVRTYGEVVGDSPVFLEVKKKIRGVIVKSRCRIPFDYWSQDLVDAFNYKVRFKSHREEEAFLEFIRLSREIVAQPVVWIRYTRESYFGVNEHYARISFDRKLLYQPAHEWVSWGRHGRWKPLDSNLAQRKMNHFSGVILELKTLSDVPHWMIDLVQYFGLERTGNCKYCNAVWQEAFFRGGPELPDYAGDILY